MYPHLAADASTQCGVFTCKQAREAGYSAKQVRVLVRRGHWVRVRRGAYVDIDVWRAAEPQQRHLLTVCAALLAVRDDSVASHDSAAVAHGLPTWMLDLSRVVLTRARGRTARTQAGVWHHVAELPADHRATVRGTAVTSPVRAALDVARVRGFEPGLVCADAALHAGASATALAAAAALMAEWPGGAVSTAVARAADGRHESPGETLTGVLLAEMRLDVEPQFAIAETSYAVDFSLEGLGVVVEFDGRVKYVTADGRPDPREL